MKEIPRSTTGIAELAAGSGQVQPIRVEWWANEENSKIIALKVAPAILHRQPSILYDLVLSRK
jgi:hypothetical protein